MTETVKFLPQSQGGRRTNTYGGMGRDLNARNFTVIEGDVVDKSRRQAIARFSTSAHFNFSLT